MYYFIQICYSLRPILDIALTSLPNLLRPVLVFFKFMKGGGKETVETASRSKYEPVQNRTGRNTGNEQANQPNQKHDFDQSRRLNSSSTQIPKNDFIEDKRDLGN